MALLLTPCEEYCAAKIQRFDAASCLVVPMVKIIKFKANLIKNTKSAIFLVTMNVGKIAIVLFLDLSLLLTKLRGSAMLKPLSCNACAIVFRLVGQASPARHWLRPQFEKC